MNKVQPVENRLLILTKYFSYGFGGTPEATLLLARGLTRTGMAVDVKANDRFISNAGKLCDLPPQQVAKADLASINVGRYLGLIVAGAWNLDALRLAIAARRLAIPVLYQTKGQLCRIEFTRPRDLRRLVYFVLIELWVPLLATRIQFTSKLEMAETLLPSFIKLRRGCVIPEPFDPERLGRIAWNKPAQRGPLRLGFIAQISPRKGLEELVCGVISWNTARPETPIELTIAGTAVRTSRNYLSEIEALANRYGGRAGIKFVGQVAGVARKRFYANTDIVVVPSHFESFCLAVPEALWFGCAVIAAPRLGVLEVLKGHPAVYILDEVSPEAIVRALDDLYDSLPSLRLKTSAFHAFNGLDPRVIALSVLRALNLEASLEMTPLSGVSG